MKLSETGIKVLKDFEGLGLQAYRCGAGVLTIGYGHTGSDVHEGLVITEQEADQLLRKDMEKFEAAVMRQTAGIELTQNQFDAMVLLTYNIGEGNFADSSVLRHLKSGDLQAAADSFMLWHKATVNGARTPIKGLARRRGAERALFMGLDWRDGAKYGVQWFDAHC